MAVRFSPSELAGRDGALWKWERLTFFQVVMALGRGAPRYLLSRDLCTRTNLASFVWCLV